MCTGPRRRFWTGVDAGPPRGPRYPPPVATTRPRRAPASVTGGRRRTRRRARPRRRARGRPDLAERQQRSNGASGETQTPEGRHRRRHAAKPAAPRASPPGDDAPAARPDGPDRDPPPGGRRGRPPPADRRRDGLPPRRRRPASSASRPTPASPTTAAASGSARCEVDIGVGMFGQAVARDEVVVTGDYPADPSFVHFPDA